MRRLLVISLLLLAGLAPASAAVFATDRLQSIAQCLSLPGLDTLRTGVHHIYKYRGRALTVRVNSYGEVSHIGFLLFPQEFRDVAPSPVHDFLERDLLERHLPNLDGALRHLLTYEHVYFLRGSAQTIFSFNGRETFSEERVDLKTYRVTWSRDGREVLKISFDMDYQMLSGCNAMELERRYPAELRRFKGALPPTVDTSAFPSSSDNYIQAGDSLFIRQMRNDLYYQRTTSGWQLTNSAAQPSQTLANLLLSPHFPAVANLRLKLKKYTYEDETLTLPYRQWLLKGLAEGCTPYFGVKEKTDKGYACTVILANRRGGYAHLLRALVPDDVLRGGGKGTVSGELYIYIPLHNVNDQYFKP